MNNLIEQSSTIATYVGLRFALHCPTRKAQAMQDFIRDCSPIHRANFQTHEAMVDFTDMQIWGAAFEMAKMAQTVNYREVVKYMEDVAHLCDQVAAGTLTLEAAFAILNERGNNDGNNEGFAV